MAEGHRRGRRGSRRAPSRLLSAPVLAAIVVLLAVGGAAAVLVATRSPAARALGHLPPSTTAATVPTTTRPPAPPRLVSVSPKPGAVGMGYHSTVTLRFSEALSPTGAMPRVVGAPPGTWTRPSPDELVFHPAGNFVPYSKVTVVVPPSIESTAGVRLGSPVTWHFTVAGASTLRLQQLLAELGYLPLRFTPSPAGQPGVNTISAPPAGGSSTSGAPGVPAGPPGPSGTALSAAPATPPTVVDEPSKAVDIPIFPVHGSFSWRFANIPPSLEQLWQTGRANVVTTGAVMAFEADHDLATDGVAGPQVWAALLKAVAARDVTHAGYDYVMVATSSPEYVSLWRNGSVIFETLANTGIPQAPTELGTWPVYVRYTVTTMSGTNPDGTPYSDPGIPWVSYFHGGDALHGFLRSQYGYPQSLGCVEMPFAAAGVLYPYTPIGTLVTVL